MARRGNGGPNGAGWGGPAKGASTKGDRPLKTDAGPGRGHVNEERLERNERWAEEMLQLYYAIATGKKRKPTVLQLAAATHRLNRLEGLPKAQDESDKGELVIRIEGGLPPRP